MSFFAILDVWLSVLRHYIALLKHKNGLAIFALMVFAFAIMLHISVGNSSFFILDLCIFISFYREFKISYLNLHYPK